MSHALLSPSSAHRWLNCTPSARLESTVEDRAGDAAKEGTIAHKLAEVTLSANIGLISLQALNAEIDQLSEEPLYEPAMHEHIDDYVVYVMEQFNSAKARTSDAMIFLEQKLNLTDYVPDGFGTGDVVIIADGILDITDLKYGKGVTVAAKENKQMMLYSLGALREFEHLFDIHTVRMTIYQPRIGAVSSWEISVSELKSWAENTLKPLAALAFAGEGEFKAGEHCRFCRIKAQCRANAEHNLQLAAYDFKNPDLLDDEEIADILNRADLFSKWVAAVEEFALTEAVEKNKKWPGYKLVEGRSNRTYTNEDAVAKQLIANGFKEDSIFTKKLLGITAMEKATGKAKFTALLSDFVVKPPGKPTLVPETDKRPAYNSAEAAAVDFESIQ